MNTLFPDTTLCRSWSQHRILRRDIACAGEHFEKNDARSQKDQFLIFHQRRQAAAFDRIGLRAQRQVSHIARTTCPRPPMPDGRADSRSEEHTSELQSLMRISYAVFCLKTTTI